MFWLFGLITSVNHRINSYSKWLTSFHLLALCMRERERNKLCTALRYKASAQGEALITQGKFLTPASPDSVSFPEMSPNLR